MANYTKTVDTNHLVTVGYEGFWGEYDSDVQYNPGNGWAGLTGQNFSVNMAHEEIDFAEIHYWPDEWFANQEDITYDAAQFLSTWFNQHAIVATALGKPLLLEEFGKAVNVSVTSSSVLVYHVSELMQGVCTVTQDARVGFGFSGLCHIGLRTDM